MAGRAQASSQREGPYWLAGPSSPHYWLAGPTCNDNHDYRHQHRYYNDNNTNNKNKHTQLLLGAAS